MLHVNGCNCGGGSFGSESAVCEADSPRTGDLRERLSGKSALQTTEGTMSVNDETNIRERVRVGTKLRSVRVGHRSSGLFPADAVATVTKLDGLNPYDQRFDVIAELPAGIAPARGRMREQGFSWVELEAGDVVIVDEPHQRSATASAPPLLSEPTYSPADALALAQALGRTKEENEKLRAEVSSLKVRVNQRIGCWADHEGIVAGKDKVIRYLEKERADLERELERHDPRLVAARRKNRGAL